MLPSSSLPSPRTSRKNSDRGDLPLSPLPSHFRRNLVPHLWKLARWLAVFYVVFATLDSTMRLLGPTGSTRAGREGGLKGGLSSWSGWSSQGGDSYTEGLLEDVGKAVLPISLSNHLATGHFPTSSDPPPWSTSFPTSISSIQLPHIATTSFFHLTTPSLFSKIFGKALHPMEIVPFFLRASGPEGKGFDEEEVTVATLFTLDRFDALITLVDRYRGQFPPV